MHKPCHYAQPNAGRLISLNQSRGILNQAFCSLDLTLYLIREDLKSHKLFSIIDKLGMGDCPYQPHLGKAILAQLNMDDGSDEIFNFYYKLIEKRSNKIKGDQKSLMKQTMKVYVELVGEKERRKTRVNIK